MTGCGSWSWPALLAPLLLGVAAAPAAVAVAASGGPALAAADDAPRLHAEPASTRGSLLPIVVNTWAGPCFGGATAAAWATLQAGGSGLDAVERGCSHAEAQRCDRTVGYGGSPDESGETSLDALIMDGGTMRAGAVANLRRVRQAASAARLVMERTRHSLLAGEEATAFAADMGLQPQGSLATAESRAVWRKWVEGRCQPNFRQGVAPDATLSCGPYRPLPGNSSSSSSSSRGQDLTNTAALELLERHGQQGMQQVQQDEQQWPSVVAHDTIAMVAVTADGAVAAGASSNGAIHKVPGRVGDAAVPGGGAYADSEVGGCGSTGDGDTHIAFLPCYQVVEAMRRGLSPQAAAEDAVRRIARRVPSYVGAVVAVSKDGRYGAAAHGWKFVFSVASAASSGQVETIAVEPLAVQAAAEQPARAVAIQSQRHGASVAV
ncbi:hypothetical protein ABPG75_006320 [Micractinium tetrahymenae]